MPHLFFFLAPAFVVHLADDVPVVAPALVAVVRRFEDLAVQLGAPVKRAAQIGAGCCFADVIITSRLKRGTKNMRLK